MDLSRAVLVAGDRQHHAALWEIGCHGRPVVQTVPRRQGADREIGSAIRNLCQEQASFPAGRFLLDGPLLHCPSLQWL